MKSRGNHEFYSGSGHSARGRGRASDNDREESDVKSASPQPGRSLLMRPKEENANTERARSQQERPESSNSRGSKLRVMSRPGGGTSDTISSETESPSQLVVLDRIKTNEKEMPDSRKLINEMMAFEDFLNEYLIDNDQFIVTSAIGPQGCGKSTVLSMLGGNDPQDLYRHYIFRPISREAIESSRYQTLRVHAYVTKSRHILLDCQAMNCASILEDAIKYSRTQKQEKMVEQNVFIEGVQLTALLLQISHNVLFCTDVAPDSQLVRNVRLAEMVRASSDAITGLNLPNLNYTRKTNIMFVHTRAKSADFEYLVRNYRVRALRRMFEDSPRLRLDKDPNRVLFPLADLKPRKDTLTGMHSVQHPERLLESEEVVDFEVGIRNLRQAVVSLPRDPFSNHSFTEKNWFVMAKAFWKDQTFHTTSEMLATLL